jgi:DNA invertase Pin-like site-specific DNA recombinase
MQNEISLETQENACRAEVAAHGGQVVGIYSDNAHSGWSLSRPGFAALQQAAARGEFDAIMFWGFDRLARDGNHALMIKLLLRHEYNIKLYCVHGYSEDDDASPQTALMEQALAVYSAFYSKLLSIETRRGKYNRALRGEFNGSSAPLGYDLVTQAQASPTRPAGLHINPRQAALVRRAFRMYATGKYNDFQLARWFNSRPLIQKLRAGRLPISKDFVREMLQNRVYTGRVCHAETIYIDEFGAGKRANRHRKQWFEGKHDGFISDELFARCKEVREGFGGVQQPEAKTRIYALLNRVYCAHCFLDKPEDLIDNNYGKMRPQFLTTIHRSYYRCLTFDRGYARCGQKRMRVTYLDDDVVNLLQILDLPVQMHEKVVTAITYNLEQERKQRHITSMAQAAQQMGIQWETLLVDEQQYHQQQTILKNKLHEINHTTYPDLPTSGEDLMRNFKDYWEAASHSQNPEKTRQKLFSWIIQRVLLHEGNLLAVILYGDVVVFLPKNAKTTPETAVAVIQKLHENFEVFVYYYFINY